MKKFLIILLCCLILFGSFVFSAAAQETKIASGDSFVMNSEIIAWYDSDDTYNVNFSSNNRTFSAINVYNIVDDDTGEDITYMIYIVGLDNVSNIVVYDSVNGWRDGDKYRIVTFYGGVDINDQNFQYFLDDNTSSVQSSTTVGDWYFKDTFSIPDGEDLAIGIDFTCNGVVYDELNIYSVQDDEGYYNNYMMYLTPDGKGNLVVYDKNGWRNEYYRYISITGGADKNDLFLLTFLSDFATTNLPTPDNPDGDPDLDIDNGTGALYRTYTFNGTVLTAELQVPNTNSYVHIKDYFRNTLNSESSMVMLSTNGNFDGDYIYSFDKPLLAKDGNVYIETTDIVEVTVWEASYNNGIPYWKFIARDTWTAPDDDLLLVAPVKNIYWSAYTIKNISNDMPLVNGDTNFQTPLPEKVGELVAETVSKTIWSMGQSGMMTVLVVCGVGCLALLIGLEILRRQLSIWVHKS